MPLGYLQGLCGYWAQAYDWRATEACEQPELFVDEVRSFFRLVR